MSISKASSPKEFEAAVDQAQVEAFNSYYNTNRKVANCPVGRTFKIISGIDVRDSSKAVD